MFHYEGKVNLCKQNNLYIANGRIGEDKNVGKTTCNDSSVIDYLILSSNSFQIIRDFDILNGWSLTFTSI